jgi:heme/copper-type cytochrome/quinol oxidase subunit 4
MVRWDKISLAFGILFVGIVVATAILIFSTYHCPDKKDYLLPDGGPIPPMAILCSSPYLIYVNPVSLAAVIISVLQFLTGLINFLKRGPHKWAILVFSLLTIAPVVVVGSLLTF